MAIHLDPQPQRAYRVLVSGYYGMANLGDEAILAAILATFRGVLGRSFHPVVATYDDTVTRHFHGPVETVPARSLQELADAIRASDLVVWGGGGLLQDHWHVPVEEMLRDPRGGIPWYLRTPFLAAATGVPCMAYGQGIGPIHRDDNRRLVGLVVNGVNAVTVRDPLSEALLRVCGVHSPPIEVTADPVLSLHPASPERGVELIRNLGLDPDRRPILAVAPRIPPPPERPGWEAALQQALAGWLDETGGSVALVAFDHAENGDELLCTRLSAGTPHRERVRTALEWLPPQDVAALLGACDVVLTMRLHALLLAAMAATPGVVLDAGPKLQAAVQSLGGGMPLCPMDPLDEAEIRRALAHVHTHASGIRRELALAVSDLRRRERRNGEIALGLLERTAASRHLPKPEPPREPRLALRAMEAEERALALATALARAEREHGRAAESLARQLELQTLARAEAESRERAALSSLHRTEEQLQDATAALAESTEELAGRIDERDTAVSSLQEVRSDRDRLLWEGRALSHELAMLKSSLGVQMVLATWRFLARHLPEDGRARRAMRATLRGLRRLLRRPSLAPLEAQATGVENGGALAAPDRSASDDLASLARFAETCNATDVSMVVAVVSGTRLAEDEGQRPTQLALELARRGIAVVFAYFRWWPTEWLPQDRVDEGILQIPLDILTAAPERLTLAFRCPEKVLLVELPHPSVFSLLAAADASGWITAYDILDDWGEFHRGGQAVWYEPDAERHLVAAADAVFAINPIIAARSGDLGRTGVEIVPNGLKPGIERIDGHRDLERGEVTVGYFGYLASAWFDWQLVASAAAMRPSWRFHLIGYGGDDHRADLPANVTLWGKKPQRELASHAANWDVAIVPFKEGKLAAGADPIKVYEYLAMGLPVVVTGVAAPGGAEELVTRAHGTGDFVRALYEAAKLGPDLAAQRRAFAASCRWEARVDTMLATLRGSRDGVGVKRRLFQGIA